MRYARAHYANLGAKDKELFECVCMQPESDPFENLEQDAASSVNRYSHPGMGTNYLIGVKERAWLHNYVGEHGSFAGVQEERTCLRLTARIAGTR